MSSNCSQPTGVGESVVLRHRFPDRLLHWSTAGCVFVLLGTGLLPVIGIRFEWVTIHWISGLVMSLLISLHIGRVVLRRRMLGIWFGLKDIDIVRSYLNKASSSILKPGKYSPAQKLMHLGVTLLTMTTILTGLLMMVRIDTPLWERNIYLLGDEVWGVVYVLHGLASLCLVTTIMLHIYFSLRPEKWMYLRSMVRGWMTAEELDRHHNKEKWAGD